MEKVPLPGEQVWLRRIYVVADGAAYICYNQRE